jgi:sulfide dehydrogenase [flavocytochrome c] flavoprotein chain
VVAISVPAGPMRCPPGPFERASLIASYLKQSKVRCKVLIFDANNRFPRQDVFSEAWRALYPGMIEWIPFVDDGAIERVAPSKMTLYTAHREYPVDVANIIPPQAPALLAVQSGLASDHGWCPVNPLTFESTLIGHVHIIGDACIADPMPKSASAANAQAKQCALAIVAALNEREAPAVLLESVCYSLLASGNALSIHGRFRSTDEGIEQLPESAESNAATPLQEAHNADAWYKGIVADSFGG